MNQPPESTGQPNSPRRCSSRSKSGQRAAIEAVREFVDTVDDRLPALGAEHPSKRQDIIDAALDMADRLVRTQYDFLRRVVDGAGKALTGTNDKK